MKTKLASWLHEEIVREVQSAVQQQFSVNGEVLRHKIPDRDAKRFDFENRQ